MATGNPTTEAQQAYDNFWPKVTDGELLVFVLGFEMAKKIDIAYVKIDIA